jgi:general secretion pathway protein G
MKTSNAFSLLEMIFAIVIISVIASVAMPKLFGTKSNAQSATLKQDIVTVTSAVQSHYLIHGNVEKISDAVTINSSIWDISDDEIVFYEQDNKCASVTLLEDTLEVEINEDVGTICKKLYDKGVRTISYALN